MKTKYTELKRIAKKTRKWALKYGHGRSDQMCRDSSALLCRYIRDNPVLKGVPYKFVEGDFVTDDGERNHCWVEINRRILIDVTADQFNYYTAPCMPPIVFTDKRQVKERYKARWQSKGMRQPISYGKYKQNDDWC